MTGIPLPDNWPPRRNEVWMTIFGTKVRILDDEPDSAGRWATIHTRKRNRFHEALPVRGFKRRTAPPTERPTP